MKKLSLIVGLLGLALPLAAASDVYKCTGNDGETAYQGTPCEPAQVQQVLIESPVTPAEQPIASAKSESAAPLVKTEPQVALTKPNHGLVVGMSDTKILNHREWGRPRKISRSRGDDGWREDWTYASRSLGTTLLRFVNGRLAEIMPVAAPQPA